MQRFLTIRAAFVAAVNILGYANGVFADEPTVLIGIWEGDSIHFIPALPDSHPDWGPIYLLESSHVEMSHCVIEGGGVFVQGGNDITIRHCRIYGTSVGIDLSDCKTQYVHVDSNIVHDCLYGIRGTMSAGHSSALQGLNSTVSGLIY